MVTAEQADKIVSDFQASLEQDFQAAKSYKVNKADWLEGKWAGLGALTEEEEMRDGDTGVSLDLLKEVGAGLTRTPDGFHVNPKIVRQLEAKKKMIETGQGIDWATGEALAFGSLVAEGTPVRLSGQDSGRGTFSQRHSVLVDQETESRYVPLSHIREGQAKFEVIDSLLSEAGVLGYEYGYSLAEPRSPGAVGSTVRRFRQRRPGDHRSVHASGEAKWLRMSGLVMLLPHGYEGQGAEHSSARLERYLQSCAEDNMAGVQFHHAVELFPCPAPADAPQIPQATDGDDAEIVAAPQALRQLAGRHVDAIALPPGVVRRRARWCPTTRSAASSCARARCTTICSRSAPSAASRMSPSVRVEQLYPWPKETVASQIRRYPAAEVIWCQEEPGNMGAWMFVMPRLNFILEETNRGQRQALYCGRAPSAAAATGVHHHHDEEQAHLVVQALTAALGDLRQPFRRATRLGDYQYAAAK